jgi:hypothetical protein
MFEAHYCPDELSQSEAVTALPADLIALYRIAHYCVPYNGSEAILRIDIRSELLLKIHRLRGVSCSAYLTAWNPGGRARPLAENIARHHRLLSRLRSTGFAWQEGEGRSPDGTWRETSVLVLGMDESEARRVGNEFEQDAIVCAGADVIPRLLLLR